MSESVPSKVRPEIERLCGKLGGLLSKVGSTTCKMPASVGGTPTPQTDGTISNLSGPIYGGSVQVLKSNTIVTKQLSGLPDNSEVVVQAFFRGSINYVVSVTSQSINEINFVVTSIDDYSNTTPTSLTNAYIDFVVFLREQ